MQHVVGGDLQLAHEQVQDLRVHRLADLQAHRRSEPPPGELALQRLQQVLVAVLLDLDVGVAGDPEDVVGADLEPREQLRQVRADELLDRQVGRRLGAADRHEAADVVGHLDPGEVVDAGRRVLDDDGEVEREPADVRERVGRVDRQRREHREQLGAEPVVQRCLLRRGEVGPQRDVDALGRERGAHVGQEAVGVRGGELAGPPADDRQLLAGAQAVGAAGAQAGALPALETGDPDHVELVEVAGEDGEELRPLEQRGRRVLGERQHPGVEVEPADLAVEEAVLRQRGDDGRRGGRAGLAQVDVGQLGGRHACIVPHRAAGDTAATSGRGRARGPQRS